MTSAPHARAKALFLKAIALPVERRLAYVAEASGNDAALREEVESLLALHTERVAPASDEPTTGYPTLRDARPRTGNTDPSLPQHLLTRAAKRLQVVCIVITLSVGILWGVVNIAQGEFGDEFVFVWQWLPPVTVLLASVSMLLAARGGVTPYALVRAGLAYEVVVSLALAISQYAGAFRSMRASDINGDVIGLSYVATWTLFFTVLVPARPAQALAALVLSNAAVPLVYLWQTTIGMAPPLSFLAFTSVFVWPYVAGVAASYIAARIVHQLGVEIRQAYDLGAYRLEALLGRGGMGEVWRASHHTLARPAAVKVIRRDALGHDPVRAAAAIARFEIEAQVIASLESPNTVGLYDFGTTEDGTIFYVMELLNGIDLDALVRTSGPLSASRTVHILSQVCNSLAEAHQRGLVHRDIKPANIYLCLRGIDRDVVKVLDFGLATVSGPGVQMAREAEGIAGTPDYMAPETIEGDTVDGRADLYALGCVAFWLLTGRVVFPRNTVAETLEAHRSSQPVAPGSLVPVPRALDELVLECLQKARERRPQSATAVATRLRSVANCLAEA